MPTYNRARQVADTLAALMAQDYPRDRLEIFVVDNSSQDNTEEVVEGLKARSPFPLHFYRKDNKGPAASRNYAIERSQSEIIAFTDSDCQMAQDWARRGVELMRPEVGLVTGPVRPFNNPERVPGFFAHQIHHGREDYVYATANAFYRRDIVVRLGGFNERYGTYPWGMPVGGEDTDLAWRVKRAGYTSVFAPDLVVHHQATDLPVIAWLIEPIRAMVMPHLVRRYPEMRAGLWCRYFSSRDQAFFYLLLGGLITARRLRGWPLVLCLPWVWEMHHMIKRDLPHPTRWWRIPIKYGLVAERQLVRTLALLFASIRHRTPVL